MTAPRLDLISCTCADGVGTITFNRPERLNALGYAMLRDFYAALSWADRDEAVRCVVLTGAGRGFCAGADVKEWSATLDGADSRADGADDFGQLNDRVVTGLYNMAKPVIASVNGVAVGMGLDIALAADLRIVSASARFSSRYITIGTIPDFGGTFLLPRLIGPTRAAELIMTGRFFDAAEASAFGLVNELVDDGKLAEKTAEWARELAAGPPVALALAKQLIRENLTASFETAVRNETRAHRLCALTDDHKEGVSASAQHRPPVFTGH